MKLFKKLIETATDEKEVDNRVGAAGPRVEDPVAAARRHLDSHFMDIDKSHEDFQHISKYIGSSKHLNNSLIDGQLPDEEDLDTHRAIHKNAKPIGAHLSVYSGSGIDLESAAKNSKDGVVHLPAHTSTSIMKDIARSFGHVNKINIKPEDKGLYVDHISSLGERELILPAKTRLKYHGRDSDDTPVFSIHSQEEPDLFTNPKKAVSDSVINLTGARAGHVHRYIDRLQSSEHYSPQMHEFLLRHFSHADTNEERSDSAIHKLVKTRHSRTPDGKESIKALSKTATNPRLLQHVMRNIPTTDSEYSDLLGRIHKTRFDHDMLLPASDVPMSSKHMHSFINHFGDVLNNVAVDNMANRDEFSVDHIRKIAEKKPEALSNLATRALENPISSVFNKLEPKERDKIHEDIISSGHSLGRHLAQGLLSIHSWKPSKQMMNSMIKNYPRTFFRMSPDAHEHIDKHSGDYNAIEGYLSNPNKRHSTVELFKKAKTEEGRQEVARTMNSFERDEVFRDPLVTNKKKESLLQHIHPSEWHKEAIDHVVLKSKDRGLTQRLLQNVSAASRLEPHHIDHILKTGDQNTLDLLYSNEGVNLTDEHRIAAIKHGCNHLVLDRYNDKIGGHPLNITHALKKESYTEHMLAARQPRITKDQLEELSKSEWADVRNVAVRNHAATPEQITSWLKRSNGDRWRGGEILTIAERQKLTPGHVDIINNHPNTSHTINYALVRNKNAKMDEGQVEKFLRHENTDVMYAALERPEIKPKHISEVLSSNAYPTYAKELAAQHQNASDNNISDALQHQNRHVRLAALYNPNIKSHHIEAATYDTDPEIYSTAKRMAPRFK